MRAMKKPSRPFQFKQFLVAQDRCAMKVTLDACVFGALVGSLAGAAATERAKNPAREYPIKRLLDIGTGTGLLSLMLAQVFSVASDELLIDAVELDADAAQQARDNAQASAFASQVNVIHSAIEALPVSPCYDLIITNPPFFSDALTGPNQARNYARHNDALSFAQLSSQIRSRLNPQGEAWVLLPVEEMQRFYRHAAEDDLTACAHWQLRSQDHTEPYRSIVCFKHAAEKRNACTADTIKTLVVRTKSGDYTPEFRELLKPFYLRL